MIFVATTSELSELFVPANDSILIINGITHYAMPKQTKFKRWYINSQFGFWNPYYIFDKFDFNPVTGAWVRKTK